MRAFGLIASVIAMVAAEKDNLTKPAQEMTQPRLRGSRSKAGKQLQSENNAVPGFRSAARLAITGEQLFDADDESCSSKGGTPGVCALASLARSATLGTSPLQNQAMARDARHGGLLVLNVTREKLERALIAEIESAVAGNHSGFDSSHLRRLEQELLPIFAALPHKQCAAGGSEGSIAHAAARYLLHQHFLRQHAWHVRGLSPARAVSPDAKSLRSRVAGHLLKVMEDKVGQQGFGLRMLAIFAATLEHLFRGDEQESLKHVWSLYGLQAEDVADGPQVRTVLESFVAHHIYAWDGENSEGKQDQGFVPSVKVAREEVEELREAYTGWPKISLFIQHEVERRAEDSTQKKLNFQDAQAIANRLLEYLREVSSSLCHEMERSIQSFSGGDKGYVKLADLRGLQFSGSNESSVDEPVDYLREMGALDDSDPDQHIFVPNYIQGPSNCDMSTSFYDLCCPNTCEKHKEHLELKLLSAKSGNSSVSVVAVITEALQHRLGSALPADMLKSLDIIASSPGGAMPIHGRVFADWLHKVFPRDCPRTRAVDWTGERGDLLADANGEPSTRV